MVQMLQLERRKKHHGAFAGHKILHQIAGHQLPIIQVLVIEGCQRITAEHDEPFVLQQQRQS